MTLIIFFFQAEDGIRDAQESRGLGDVYKRQNDHWVGLITVMDKDWNTIKVRSELGDEFNSKKLFNNLLNNLVDNGYKLISIK